MEKQDQHSKSRFGQLLVDQVLDCYMININNNLSSNQVRSKLNTTANNSFSVAYVIDLGLIQSLVSVVNLVENLVLPLP